MCEQRGADRVQLYTCKGCKEETALRVGMMSYLAGKVVNTNILTPLPGMVRFCFFTGRVLTIYHTFILQ